MPLGSPKHSTNSRYHLETTELTDGVLYTILFVFSEETLKGFLQYLAFMFDAWRIETSASTYAFIQWYMAEEVHP